MKKGFTLIELLVVVLIIGILSAVALPQYQKAVTKARYGNLKVMVHSVAKAEEIYYLANGSYAENLEDLDIDIGVTKSHSTYIFDWGKCYVYNNSDGHGDRLSCHNNTAQMGYMIYFNHSRSAPGKSVCIADTAESASVPYQVCKAETGVNSPIYRGTYYMFYYP